MGMNCKKFENCFNIKLPAIKKEIEEAAKEYQKINL